MEKFSPIVGSVGTSGYGGFSSYSWFDWDEWIRCIFLTQLDSLVVEKLCTPIILLAFPGDAWSSKKIVCPNSGDTTLGWFLFEGGVYMMW